MISTAIRPSQLPQRTHVVVVPESDWERAVVKWFNRLRGFGFLTLDSQTPDVFVHMETLRRFGFTELRPSQTVLVRYGRGPNGSYRGRTQARRRTAVHPVTETVRRLGALWLTIDASFHLTSLSPTLD